MIDEIKIKKFCKILLSARKIALICHINPDSDAIGSMLAFKIALSKLGKEVYAVCDDIPPEKLRFLPHWQEVTSDCGANDFDAASAIDCGDENRMGISAKYFKRAAGKLIIDHHKSNSCQADYVLCDEKAAATAEIIYKIIKYLERAEGITLMDDEIAVLLFAAITGDTGAFSFSNTTAETMIIAAELKGYNFSASDVIFRLIRSTNINNFKLKARILGKASFYSDNRIGLITFTKDDFSATDTTPDSTEGVINEIINIDSVKIAISVAEVYDKNFKVSFRTKEPYDASECAAVFGGGGHIRAAGCRISGFYEDVVEKLLKAAEDCLC